MNEINSAYDQINNPQRYQQPRPGSYGQQNPFSGGYSSGYGYGYQQRQYTTYDTSQDSNEFRAAWHFIQNAEFSDALELLNRMGMRGATPAGTTSAAWPIPAWGTKSSPSSIYSRQFVWTPAILSIARHCSASRPAASSIRTTAAPISAPWATTAGVFPCACSVSSATAVAATGVTADTWVCD